MSIIAERAGLLSVIFATVRTRAASHPLTNFFVIDKLCGESGIISFAEAKSMDFVSNQGSHPFLPSLHCGESGITFVCRGSLSDLRFATVRTRAASHPLTNFFVIDKLCGESGIRTRGTVTRTSV